MEQEQMFLTTKSADSTTITHILYPLIVVLSAYFFLRLKILVDYIPPAAMIPRSAGFTGFIDLRPQGGAIPCSPPTARSTRFTGFIGPARLWQRAPKRFTGFIDLRPQGGAIPCSPLAARSARICKIYKISARQGKAFLILPCRLLHRRLWNRSKRFNYEYLFGTCPDINCFVSNGKTAFKQVCQNENRVDNHPKNNERQ